LTEPAAAQAVDYVRRGLQALGAIPDSKTLVVERFFDGLGGTQIVIHAPFGIRFNRGLGLALRKRLCQSFDFEIQASAIDDGVLIALNSRHSFPLEETLAMLPARNARGVLEQAMIAAPMFEVRFRHVASRALTVIRAARGARIPAWIQRLRSQEALAALFPQQQACFENRPPAIEIPEHFIVAETMRECLTESADAEKMERVLAGVADGSVRAVYVDSVSPSVFAHRLLLAWDYSFLDGGERANRRSRTVSMNRGMAEDVFRSEDLSAMLAEDAVRAVAAEVTGIALGYRARNRDELYELIRSQGALSVRELEDRAGEGARAMLAELASEKRIARLLRPGSAAEIVIASEDAAIFAAAYPGAEIVDAPEYAAADPDGAQQELVRRALKTSGPITADELALRLGFEMRVIERVLPALEAGGAVFRGHFTSSTAAQWCERYNLERIHRMTLARVRAEIEPCADHEFAAFRLRWMYVGGGDISADPSGVTTVLEQLSGLSYAPGFWERAILPARIRGYRPEMLDVVCLGGQMRWAAAAQDGEDRATPGLITFIARRGAVPGAAVMAAIDDPREQRILAALGAGGAQYLDQISERANLSERDTLAALWRLAARGFASNDSFAPLRMLATDPSTADAIENTPLRGFTRHDAAIRARLKSSVSGRWSVIEAAAEVSARAAEDADPAREFALRLLARNGILSREMLALERCAMTWHDVSFALRRLEYGGTIRRGWFVRTLSAEQYALSEAVEMLREARALNPAREKPIAISAADPANPYGAMLPGCGVARDAANIVVLRAGRAVLGLASRALVTIDELDDDAFSAAVAALIEVRPKIVLDTIDGEPALASARVGMLAAMRFHSDGRALVFDGLPGPAPARAAHARRG
ncbi:MAG: hypothetical protein WAM05_15145, partial [Candidatus Binataceae bacterium]